MHEMIPISSLKPNPFRDLDRYPIDRFKIDNLTVSFETTGYWGNILARERGGAYEIAYGHHRLEALRRRYDPHQQVPIIVEPLTDEQMIKIMARENAQEWNTNPLVTMETIRTIVFGFAEGKIRLNPVSGQD